MIDIQNLELCVNSFRNRYGLLHQNLAKLLREIK